MPADSVSRMNSNGSNNGTNPVDASMNTSNVRSRTVSESSDKTTRFILPSMDGSPPKVLTLNEVSDVVKNIQNMELAHEIALNSDFKLQPYEPPVNSLERRVKDIMHKAFWDILREQLQQIPPCYDHAIQLLGDIKECFPQILSHKNSKLAHINEVLDEAVIRQQAENGVLDFRSYANFVIEIMAQSCAPARDETIEKLKEIDDVIDTFKGILETMTLMKLDMANFVLDHARNDILANSVEYEKQKFNEYLEYYKLSFPATENWLQRNRLRNENNVECKPEASIWNAYMELMDWPEEEIFPEVLSIDKVRILKLGLRAKRLSVCASLISICTGIPIISQRTENRQELAKQLDIILQHVAGEREISESMSNIWEQIKSSIQKFLEKEQQSAMDGKAEDVLKTQVLQIANKNSPVRQLMWKRLRTYFNLILLGRPNTIPPAPPGFTDYSEELLAFATSLRRVICYNHAVFGDYLKQLLNKLSTEGSTTSTIATSHAVDTDASSSSSSSVSNPIEENSANE